MGPSHGGSRPRGTNPEPLNCVAVDLLPRYAVVGHFAGVIKGGIP